MDKTSYWSLDAPALVARLGSRPKGLSGVEARRWDMRFIRNFMVVFGLVSSLFDYLTFGLLLWWFQSTPEQFRLGWFIQSLMTELLVALMVCTRRPFFRSRAGGLLLWSTILMAALTVGIPYLLLGVALGFVPLPKEMLLGLLLLTLLYVLEVKATKKAFYRMGPT